MVDRGLARAREHLEVAVRVERGLGADLVEEVRRHRAGARERREHAVRPEQLHREQVDVLVAARGAHEARLGVRELRRVEHDQVELPRLVAVEAQLLEDVRLDEVDLRVRAAGQFRVPLRERQGVRRDVDVLYEDADEGLGLLPDGAYDLAVLSETLQTVKKPREILVKILDKAREAVVTIPNFASIGIRLHLLFTGRMPVGEELPFEWYDTPNTHFFTFHDFRALCAKENIEIKTVQAEASGLLGRLLIKLGFVNLGADRVICRLARRA